VRKIAGASFQFLGSSGTLSQLAIFSGMKTVVYTRSAARDLRKHRSVAKRLAAKIGRYAETGAGDVKQLAGSTGKRLRDGDFRLIFEETATEIIVTKIGPRGDVYD
jgi:mRNA interferase RelE/StbE